VAFRSLSIRGLRVRIPSASLVVSLTEGVSFAYPSCVGWSGFRDPTSGSLPAFRAEIAPY
jgi:hypothetical protein